jgi:hypothetical protein
MKSGQQITKGYPLISNIYARFSLLATLHGFVCPVARTALAAKFTLEGKKAGCGRPGGLPLNFRFSLISG